MTNMIIQTGQLTRADGSAILVSPEAVLQCAIRGPLDVAYHKEVPGKGTIDVVFKTAAKSKETSPQIKTLQVFLKKLIESVILVDLYPRSAIEIIVQEMESDGQLMAPSINCICSALLDSGLSMASTFAAITCVITPKYEIIVNPDSDCIRKALTTMVIVFESVNSEVLAMKTEGKPFTQEQLQKSLSLSKEAANEIFNLYRETVKRNFFLE